MKKRVSRSQSVVKDFSHIIEGHLLKILVERRSLTSNMNLLFLIKTKFE